MIFETSKFLSSTFNNLGIDNDLTLVSKFQKVNNKTNNHTFEITDLIPFISGAIHEKNLQNKRQFSSGC